MFRKYKFILRMVLPNQKGNNFHTWKSLLRVVVFPLPMAHGIACYPIFQLQETARTTHTKAYGYACLMYLQTLSTSVRGVSLYATIRTNALDSRTNQSFPASRCMIIFYLVQLDKHRCILHLVYTGGKYSADTICSSVKACCAIGEPSASIPRHLINSAS